MFCPLCKAEYREGFVICSFCRADLVSEDVDDNQRNPLQLAWMTRDRREYDRVVGQLRDADVACREELQGDHWLYAITGKRPTFFVFILARDAEQANQSAGVEFRPLSGWQIAPKVVLKQTCPVCGTEFPAGVWQCPGCKTDLLAWKPREAAPEGGSLEEEPARDGAEEDGPLEVVWRGGDPVTYSRALLALREAGITCVTSQNFDHMVFEWAMPRPRLEIRVYASELNRARDLLHEFQDPFPLVPQEPPEAPAEEPETTAEPYPSAEAPEMPSPQAAPMQVPADYEARKDYIRWGGGLVLLSMLLGGWVLGAAAPYGLVFHRGLGGFRLVAVIALSGISTLCGLAAFWLLYRAWAWRADKIGFLAWFFAFEGVVLLWYLAFVLSL